MMRICLLALLLFAAPSWRENRENSPQALPSTGTSKDSWSTREPRAWPSPSSTVAR